MRLNLKGMVMASLLGSLLALLFGRVVADEIGFGETSMGMGVPRWWFTVFSPLLCGAIALRSAGVAWSAARALDDER